MDDLDALSAILKEGLPFKVDGGQLSLYEADGAPLSATEDPTLMLSRCFETFEQNGARRDLKIQGLYFIDPADRTDPRRYAYVRGWVRALPHLFDINCSDGNLDHFMPHTLVYPEALDDQGLQTAEEFTAAFSSPEKVHSWWTGD